MQAIPRLKPAYLLAAMTLFVLCVTRGPALGQPSKEVIGPGDTVRITAYRHPDLTTEARLSEQGKVNVPLIGETKLQGMTPDQAAEHIAERLRRGKFIVNPQIGVAIVQARSRQVSVLGFVAKPGRYVLDGTSARLSDVIAMAGGLLPTGSDTVTLQRGGEAESLNVDMAAVLQNGDKTKDIEVRSGDSIFVPKAPVFYIYGEVEKGGAYRLEPDMTVTQAIAVAGGITPRGSENRLQLRRKGSDGRWKHSSVRLLDPVRADDVIFVRESLF